MSDDELRNLRRWKAEAMPVIQGLQGVGHALGVPLGTRITAKATVDRALDLRNERDAAVAEAKCRKVADLDLLRDLLDEHSIDETSYDAGDIWGCECGFEVDRNDLSTTWPQYRDHLAGVILAALTTPSPGAPAPAEHDRKA